MYGWRARIGVIEVSNDIVSECEYWRMAPEGVALHSARMHMEDSLDGIERLKQMAPHARQAAIEYRDRPELVGKGRANPHRPVGQAETADRLEHPGIERGQRLRARFGQRQNVELTVHSELLHLRPRVPAGVVGDHEDDRDVNRTAEQNAAENEEQCPLHEQALLRISGMTKSAMRLPVVSAVS